MQRKSAHKYPCTARGAAAHSHPKRAILALSSAVCYTGADAGDTDSDEDDDFGKADSSDDGSGSEGGSGDDAEDGGSDDE